MRISGGVFGALWCENGCGWIGWAYGGCVGGLEDWMGFAVEWAWGSERMGVYPGCVRSGGGDIGTRHAHKVIFRAAFHSKISTLFSSSLSLRTHPQVPLPTSILKQLYRKKVRSRSHQHLPEPTHPQIPKHTFSTPTSSP